ncbi:MAG TPA: hypothetical protein VGG75_23635 [Trebonia sp.]
MPARPVQSGNVIVRGPYGNDSATPLPDGSVPAGYPIKGNAGSMRYHTKKSPSYNDTKASVFFRTEGSALFAGFRPWNWRSSADAPGADLPGPRDADQSLAEAGIPEPVSVFTDGTGAAAETGHTGATLTATRPETDALRERVTQPETNEWPPAPYGKDSAAPLADGSAPEGFTIKGKSGSMLFHSEESPYYRRTKAEAWFRTEEAAVAAGFRPWNWRKRQD